MTWPITMPDLQPGDFVHGKWILAAEAAEAADGVDDISGSLLMKSPRRVHDSPCGRRLCLVGWIRHSFGLSAAPDNVFPDEAIEFLRVFCEKAGRPLDSIPFRSGYAASSRRYVIQLKASDLFEGARGVYDEALSEHDAARAWSQTLRHFDYTVDAAWIPPR